MQQAKAASAAGTTASAAGAATPDSSGATAMKGKQGKSKQSAAASTQAAVSKKTAGKPGRPAGRAQQTAQASSGQTDAITLLKNDHRTVEQLFKSYEEAQATSAKSDLARQICMELIIHAHLEEQIFYPACRENGVEDDALDEAQVEHDGAKVMIADLLNGSPEDTYYDAKVKVLKEYIKHHVNEEEKSDGIFAKARQASLNLDELGTQLKSMKDELTAEGDAVADAPLEAPSLQLNNINAMSEETQMPRQSNYDDEDDYRSSRSRGGSNRMRDEDGRFTSGDDDDRGGRGRSRSSRSSYDDDEDDNRSSRGRSGGGRGQGGWFGDSEGHSEAARQGWRSRDDDDDDDRGGRGRSRSSRSSYDDEDDGRSSRGRSGGNRSRDEEGRFMSDDDDDRGGRGRGRSSRSSYDDDEDDNRSSRGRSGGGRGHGGWFGDPEGHSRAAMQRQQSQSSSDDDDDRGGRSRGRSQGGGQGGRSQGSRSQGSRGRNEGHGGWFGDSEGHSQAARRGWRDRD
jgi:hypothetical protein